MKAAFDAEKDNMLEAIIVFSDGAAISAPESRQGDGKEQRKVNPELEKLHRMAQTANIPLIAIGIGEEHSSKIGAAHRSAEPPGPRRRPTAFKLIVEVDGENMPGVTKDVAIEIKPENSETPFELPGKVTFDQSKARRTGKSNGPSTRPTSSTRSPRSSARR